MDRNTFDKYRSELRKIVLSKIDCFNDIEDEEVYKWIDEALMEKCRTVYLSISDRKQLRLEIFNSLRKLDVLQEIVDCSDITEIMVNGTEHIFIEKAGQIYEWDRHFESREKLWDVIQHIVSKTNRIVNESSPIVDTRLENGSRVNVVLPPIAINGPIVTIEDFRKRQLQWKDCLSLIQLMSLQRIFWKSLSKQNIT